MTDAPRFLTPQELSDRYQGTIGVRTLTNWRSSGLNGPAYVKVGGRVLYRLSDVEAWEDRRTAMNTSQYGNLVG